MAAGEKNVTDPLRIPPTQRPGFMADIVRLGGVEAWRESFDRIDDIIDNTMEIENGFASAGMQ
mgnify:CR=1 FL=1